jgi:protein-disulfide isomerase
MRIVHRVFTGISRHWRTALESVATVLVILVCVNLLVGRGSGAGALGGPPRPGARPPRPEPKLPPEPVSLEGAALQGSRSARVALIQFSDFECPYCGKFARETEPVLKKEYIDTGRLLYAFRHLPLDRIHQYATKAAATAECAGQQGKFWEVHGAFFDSPAKLNDDVIRERVSLASLDLAALDACVAGPGAARIKKDITEAQTLGITGTPTLLLGSIQSDGKVKVTQRLSGAQPIERLREAIDGLLGSAGAQGTR